MINYEELRDYLSEEYPDESDIVGLLLDVINELTDVEELKAKVKDYVAHE